MAESYWKTRTRAMRREQVTWPSSGQIVRQFGLIALISVVWAVALFGCVSSTGEQVGAPPSAEGESGVAIAEPTETPSPPATQTSVPATATPGLLEPSPTPTLAVGDEQLTPALAPTPEAPTSEPPSPEAEPSPTFTSAPTLAPTATEPPPPPTDTPVPPPGQPSVSFAAEVLPIFERRCANCHGGNKTEEGLNLRNYAAVLAGSWNGPVIEPGNAEESYLVKQIVSGKMPKRGPRLLPAEIQLIKDWINAGAPDN